ncbi:MAG: HU family DNA-binding protein [Chloroflexi bacterium]|nr:HU family DNA-binding protein [Chloroflexota bacterium]
MTVTKKVTVREISRRSGLTYKQAELAVSALIEVWSEALANGEKIAIDNFFILEVREIYRPQEQAGHLLRNGELVPAPRIHKRLLVRPGLTLRRKLKK